MSGCPSGCIHELFEEQAARTPDARALQFGADQLCYGELNRRANGVAHYLIQRGVKPETFVGLRMERSLDAVVCLLGILKAGGAYVYLDPSYPEARLEEMIEDSRPLLVLESVPDGGNGAVNPRTGVHLDNASYLIYTSGSTGKPKAAVEVHRSMVNRLASAPLPDIRSGDVCVLNSSFSFGISASRLFLPLVSGVPVVILPDEDVQDIARFVLALGARGITSVFMVPSVLRQILQLGELAAVRLGKLRSVAVSGGALTREIAEAFFALLPNAILVNVYGGSEIGTAATLGVLTRESDLGRLSIGRPVVNTTIHIAGGEEGGVGEICVEARHLARGYLNQPELTAERFVPAPGGGRMYRTGDLGRWLASGEIEFLGRADHQVKIRGFRVELGEIEAALHSDPGVLEAAATAYEFEGEKRLAAYVVARSGSALSTRALRERLARRLPDHMIPATVMSLAVLPRTDNGKVDRSALPKVDPGRPDLDNPFVAPSTEVERTIAALWEEILQVRPVGVHDHFLDLGGDSLAATEIMSAIWKAFDIRVGFRAFFDHATVFELASVVTSARDSGGAKAESALSSAR